MFIVEPGLVANSFRPVAGEAYDAQAVLCHDPKLRETCHQNADGFAWNAPV